MAAEPQQDRSNVKLPRIAITFCTQCRWMLRAAYYGQELLSTFGTDIGEIALIPATGGIFTVEITLRDASKTMSTALLWDRKTEAGFPETKVLKQRVRDYIAPEKGLGHSDTPSRKTEADVRKNDDTTQSGSSMTAAECGDCR